MHDTTTASFLLMPIKTISISILKEVLWPSGESAGVGSRPVLTTWICFTVALFSNPRPGFVNSQLVCLPPVGSLHVYFTDLLCPQLALQC